MIGVGAGEPPAPRYRADIDGLRAVAVMAVIGYHARLPGFSGGYVGVDVFFVISGFLITQLLLGGSAPLRTPAALREFYGRRARRILPALYLVLLVSAVAALLVDFPQDLRHFGRSLALASACLGNFAAWFDGGYFDPGERFTPLRHLWSIGVEEQFYLFYPWLLLPLRRPGVGVQRACLLLAFAASLLLSYLARSHWPVPNFYMLPSRAWELLAGALVALTPALARGPAVLHQALTLAATFLLGFTISQSRIIGFPGSPSLLACAGASLLLAGNTRTRTLAGRALAWRPLVFTGLISYSLYLWHAPVLAFLSYYHVFALSWPARLGTLGGVYGIAWLSWAWVEQPVRRPTTAALRRGLVPGALAASLALLGLGLSMTGGLVARLRPDPLTPVDAAASVGSTCLDAAAARIAAGDLCSFGPAGAAVRAVVWGDSHAYALLPVYRELARERGIRIYFGVMGACWPLLGAEAAGAGEFWRTRCAAFNQAMMSAIARLHPARVILNAYWLDPGAAAEGEFQRRAPGLTGVQDGIENTLRAVASNGATVCAVLSVPSYDYPVPYALAMARRRGLDVATLAVTRQEALGRYQAVESVFRDLQTEGRLIAVDPKRPLCPHERCELQAADGESLYRDASHLSVRGAQAVHDALGGCLTDPV